MSLQGLWEPTNLTMYSSVFTVPSGMSCILTAHKFREKRLRGGASEVSGPQIACIRRIIFGFNPEKEVGDTVSSCGYIYSIPQSGVEKLVDQVVSTDGCGVWHLSKCRNMAIIGLPGIYRLELNDSSVVGDAQVYAEWYKSIDIPLHLTSLYFF